MEIYVYDYLNWAKDKEILSSINSKEILYYSGKIIKTNHFNMSQERSLVLTDEALYNFQKKKLKRRIRYNQIRGITYSELSQEFVVHGNDDEYDYLFQSSERNLLISLIAKFYPEQNNGQTLKICKVNEKTLKNYVTGKKEKKKDKNYSKMNESKLIDTKEFLENNSDFEKRFRTSSSINMLDEEKIPDENPAKINSALIFSKDNKITNVSLEDFKVLKILGRGAFGKVYLVKFNQTNQLYAMKSIKKIYLNDQNEINNIFSQKKIFQKLNYPFLIDIYLTFKTDDRIYIIMNVVQGENLCEYLRKHINFDEKSVKFYAAIIGLTIQYLHENGISYRELRPDNIIIDKNGYLKISSFKMGKLFKLKSSFTIVKESSEYLAPEVVSSNDCKSDADWWSYGIILYELLFGIPPFYSDDDNNIREQIKKNELRFPKSPSVSKNAKDFIKKLLIKNPTNRLGHAKGFEEIKKHEFFKGINFDNLINKTIGAEYKPTIEGDILKQKEKVVEVTYEDLINSKILLK